MNTKLNNNLWRVLVTLIFSTLIVIGLIFYVGENPMNVLVELINGAFGSTLRLGTTLAGLTPILLTATAFAVAAKTGVFNIGTEGSLFLGALAATYVGINFSFLPRIIHIIVCFLAGMVAGGFWSFIPAFLKVKYNVNEITVGILLNTVAVYITSYFINGPMSSGGAIAKSHPVTVELTNLLAPSNANTGIFLAVIAIALIQFLLKKTTFGFKVQATGTNKLNAEYAGMNPNQVIIKAMILSGSVAGFAGAIEILGVYGSFIDNFGAGLGTQGMLIALISGNNLLAIPFVSTVIAALNSGGKGLQISTNVPKSLIDTFIAVIIIFATMEDLGGSVKRFTKKIFQKSDVRGGQNGLE